MFKVILIMMMAHICVTTFCIRFILGCSDTSRNDCSSIVFCHFLISLVELLIFKATIVNNCSFAVIRYENSSDTAKEFVHVDMCSNPRSCFHIQKSFHVGILVVGHNANKNIGFYDFTGIRINDCSRITCLIYFHLFTRFTIDMHGNTMFLLILLDVIAELGIHEWLFTVSTAVFHVLRPQELWESHTGYWIRDYWIHIDHDDNSSSIMAIYAPEVKMDSGSEEN